MTNKWHFLEFRYLVEGRVHLRLRQMYCIDDVPEDLLSRVFARVSVILYDAMV